MTDKTKNVVVVISFMLMLVLLFVLNLLKPTTEISLSERRKLAKFPEITIQKLTDGTFSKEFEKYTTDQMIKREDFRKIKTVLEIEILRKKDNHNLYLYEDSLIKIEYPLNEKSVEKVADKINTIQNNYFKNSKCYYTIVPDKNYFTNPEEYIRMDYEKLQKLMTSNIEKAEYIPIFDCLQLSDYYITDIHWKQENLSKVVDKIATKMGFKEKLQTPYTKQEIIELIGQYAGQLPVKTKQDSICILTNQITQDARVYHYENKKETKLYDLEKMDSNDKYDIYLSGATPIATITNPNAKTKKELVLFRDSFGSSLAPLFVEGYSKITLVDIRYMRTIDLPKYIEIENQDVLFLYSTFVLNNSSILK